MLLLYFVNHYSKECDMKKIEYIVSDFYIHRFGVSDKANNTLDSVNNITLQLYRTNYSLTGA